MPPRPRVVSVEGMTTPAPLVSTPLVSTQWLADHLGADDLVVLDATVLPYSQPNGRPGYLSGHEQYIIDGHIPGAVFADLTEVFSDASGAYPFTRPSGHGSLSCSTVCTGRSQTNSRQA